MKAVLPLLAALSLAACSTPAANTSVLPGSAGGMRGASDLLGSAPLAPQKLLLSLFDAPLPTNGLAVNIAIDGVQLLNGNAVTNWQSFSSPDVVNLLDLQSSSHDFMDYAPNGSYTGVRFLVNSLGSSVSIDGMNIPIVWVVPSVASGNGSGAADVPVDFAVKFTIGGTATGATNNGNVHLALDFNVFQSVSFRNGAIYITPVTSAAVKPGQLKGKVLNKKGKGVGSATVAITNSNGVIVNVTTTHDDGSYQLNAIPPGTYNLTVQNSYISKSGTPVAAKGFDAGATPPSASVTIAPEQQLQLGNLID